MLNSGLIVESSKYLIREGYWTQTMAIWHAGMQRNRRLIDRRLYGGLLKEFLLIACKGDDKATWSMRSLSMQHANSSARVYLPACEGSPEECCVLSEQGKPSPGFFLIVRTNAQVSSKMKSPRCSHNSCIISESIWDPSKWGAKCPLLPMCPLLQVQAPNSSMISPTTKSSSSVMDQCYLKVF